MRRFILALLLLATIQSSVYADEVYISDRGGSHVGYIIDTWLWGYGTTLHWNAGTSPSSFTGDSIGGDTGTLWRVDLSSIPDGSPITAAEIVLIVDEVNTGGVTIRLYEIADANNGWVEGTKVGSVETGSPGWNHHTHNTITWDSPGLSTPGTDYINTLLGAVVATSLGTKTLTLNAAGRTAIEDRLASDDIEFIFRSSSYVYGHYARWHSSEASSTPDRPYMKITYTSAEEPVALSATIIRR